MASRTRLFMAAIALVALPSQAAAEQKVTRSGRVMGTQVSLTLWTDDEQRAAEASKAVLAEFERIDRLMSSWLGTSDVSLINAMAGEEGVPVGDEVFNLIIRSIEFSKKSQGAFDITVGAFRGLWKFDEDLEADVPSESEIVERRKLVGWKDIVIDAKKRTVKLKRRGMRITLGGIAKGYAVDRAVALLHNMDLLDFILQAGGDLYVSGAKGSDSWIVGIRDPRRDRQTPFASADVRNRTFSTSGDYEKSFIVNDVRYHHILDPKKGRPALRSRSVTVSAANAATADAWSTALFVLGVEKGMKLVEGSADLEAVFVDADNRVHVSSGLKDKLRIHHPPTPGI